MDVKRKETLTVALIAGEVSGDILGSGLIREIQRQVPGVRFEGIGGDRMKAAGMVSWYPMEMLSIMGLFEVLRHLPALLQLKKSLLERWAQSPPDIFIGIDAPDFNLRIEAALHVQGVTTVHYVSPSVWAWRQGRIEGIRRSVDHMLTLLPFEASFYEQHQVPVTFVGHPMADEIPLQPDRQKALDALSLGQAGLDKTVIAVLPGSRGGEVARLMPVFIETMQYLLRQRQDLHFVVPAANSLRLQQIQGLLEEHQDLPVTVVKGQARECMTFAASALVASGTVTLECMLVKTPMVVAYRLAPLTYWIMKLMMRAKHIALPNLLADERIVPELVQNAATPAALGRAILEQLHPEKRATLLSRFTELHQAISANADEQAAKVVSQLLQVKAPATQVPTR